jgi:dienelactone hydrolase
MTDWVQDLADQVAAAGYIAVAPDLLSGMGPNGGRSSDFAGDKTMEAVGHLNPDQVTADLNAAADYALKLPASSSKLFVAGFCWGGSQTFRFATNRPDLAAAFVFYGGPPEKDAMARIKAPLRHVCGNDARINATLSDATPDESGRQYDPVTYECWPRLHAAGEALTNDATKSSRGCLRPLEGHSGRSNWRKPHVRNAASQLIFSSSPARIQSSTASALHQFRWRILQTDPVVCNCGIFECRAWRSSCSASPIFLSIAASSRFLIQVFSRRSNRRIRFSARGRRPSSADFSVRPELRAPSIPL